MIEANEQKLAIARKRLEKLKAAKTQVQENLTAHSSRLESLQVQLATRRFLSEEELRVQVLVEAEKAHQHASPMGTNLFFDETGLLAFHLPFFNTPSVE